MTATTEARRGPTDRRTSRVIVVFGATLAVTILAVPCLYTAVASLLEVMFAV